MVISTPSLMNRMSGTVRNTINQGVQNYDQPGTQLFTRI